MSNAISAAATTIGARRCTFTFDDGKRQCELEGTHRVVLLLQDARCTLVKKAVLAVNGQGLSRCPGHQMPTAAVYFDTPMWEKMAQAYVRSALEVGRELVPVRGLTRVQFEPEDVPMGAIPVLAARPDGQLEVIGKARLVK